MGAFVVESNPLAVGFVEPDHEIAIEESERGWEVWIEVFD